MPKLPGTYLCHSERVVEEVEREREKEREIETERAMLVVLQRWSSK
jgi:hypothetical protein